MENPEWLALVELHQRMLDCAYGSGLPNRAWKAAIRRVIDIKNLHQNGRNAEAVAAIEALIRDSSVPAALMSDEVREAANEAKRRLGAD